MTAPGRVPSRAVPVLQSDTIDTGGHPQPRNRGLHALTNGIRHGLPIPNQARFVCRSGTPRRQQRATAAYGA